ncbi:hypothetical protein AB205_0019400, partial [Aquarana catesbeiana]
LRKRWSDLKLREHEQYRKIRRVLQKSKYLCCVPILFGFITFVLLHVLLGTVVQFIKWQLSCSWAHYSFGSHIFISDYKISLFRPYAFGHHFDALYLASKNRVV